MKLEDLVVDPVLVARVKRELRKRMRGLRNAAPLSACQQRSALIVEALWALPQMASAEHVALFWPIEERHEVDLRALDQRLRERGSKVYYPAIDPDSREMSFRQVSSPELELEERGLGFREPPSSAPLAPASLLVVAPALAIAPSGHRLGYGAGFYDRALTALGAAAWTVAVAYDYQLLADLPHTEHDAPVQALVTDRRTLSPT